MLSRGIMFVVYFEEIDLISPHEHFWKQKLSIKFYASSNRCNNYRKIFFCLKRTTFNPDHFLFVVSIAGNLNLNKCTHFLIRKKNQECLPTGEGLRRSLPTAIASKWCYYCSSNNRRQFSFTDKLCWTFFLVRKILTKLPQLLINVS